MAEANQQPQEDEDEDDFEDQVLTIIGYQVTNEEDPLRRKLEMQSIPADLSEAINEAVELALMFQHDHETLNTIIEVVEDYAVDGTPPQFDVDGLLEERLKNFLFAVINFRYNPLPRVNRRRIIEILNQYGQCVIDISQGCFILHLLPTDDHGLSTFISNRDKIFAEIRAALIDTDGMLKSVNESLKTRDDISQSVKDVLPGMFRAVAERMRMKLCISWKNIRGTLKGHKDEVDLIATLGVGSEVKSGPVRSLRKVVEYLQSYSQTKTYKALQKLLQTTEEDEAMELEAPEVGILSSRAITSSHTDSDDQKGLRTIKLKESDEDEDEKYKAKPSQESVGTTASSAKEKAAGQKEEPLLAWYRHSGEPAIDEIPVNAHLRVTDEDSVAVDVGDHFITHMSVKRRVPALDKLTPQVSHLEIDSLSSNSLEQLQCLSSLKHLEVLCLRNCDFSAGLPRVITRLTSLKSLSLEGCELSTLPTSLSTLQALEVLCLKSCDFSAGLPDLITRLASLKSLSLHRCELSTLPSSLSKLSRLEVLDISMNQLSTVRSFFYRLKNLMSFNRSNSGISSFPDTLSKLTKLEVLDLSFNQLATVPNFVYKLKNLKSLNLHHTRISTVPDSLSELKNLEVLDISMNQLATLPNFVCELMNLKSLNLNHSRISSLPDSLSGLTKLEFLDMSRNLLSTVPGVVCSLMSLRNLNLSDTGISSLPDSLSELTKLEDLHISRNKLAAVPSILCNLKNLKGLDLSNTGISSLPESLRSLQQLETLNIEGNDFKELPAVVYQLTHLHTLNLRLNYRLEKIDKHILNLRYLEDVDCSYCEALDSPPYLVCRQGLPATKKYFKDLEVESVIKFTVIPVAVVGAQMVGKTSIVRSLQTGRRILTNRTQTAEVDEATKVFKMEELALDNAHVMFTDFGGHDVYHIAYPLTINRTYVPCIVINMQQYNELASSQGVREATRRLCYDLMSHLYLPCPELGSPILVLTHKDQFSDERFGLRRQELLTSAETIRQELLADVQKFQNSIEISHLANISKPLFQNDDIFVFGNDLNDVENIKAFKKRLASRSKQFQRIIPGLWKRVIVFIESRSDQSFLLVSDVLDEFPGDDLFIILRYLHDIGKVLWYENIDGLSSYIFHKIPAITDMIALLLHHSADAVWEERVESFICIEYRQQIIEIEEYQQLVNCFRESGIMDEALLVDLLQRGQQFPVDISLKLLQTFHLIHGPIKQAPRNVFVIPCLSPCYRDNPCESDDLLHLRVDITFKGLLLPDYVLHLVTVGILNLHFDTRNNVVVFQNGCSIYCDEVAIHLLHDSTSRKVTLQISTTVDLLGSSWKLLLSTTEHILQQTTRIWKATRPVCIFYCSHCLFTREDKPDVQINPGWFQWNSKGGMEKHFAKIKTFSGVRAVACRNVRSSFARRHQVPMPLRFPYYELSTDETSRVRDYLLYLKLSRIDNDDEDLRRKRSASSDEQSTPSDEQSTSSDEQFTSSDEQSTSSDEESRSSDSGLSDMYTEEENFQDFNDPRTKKISLKLTPVRKERIKVLYNNTKKVYQMSNGIRGRVLIININKFTKEGAHATRVGSEVDYDNLSRMFKGMGFDVAKTEEQLTDLTAEEILQEIHEETEKDMHTKLGMFILVIMSHGARGDILFGSDTQPVDLVQIKDLLSAVKFPAMEGKPKLIIIASDAGDRADVGTVKTRYLPNIPSGVSTSMPSIRKQKGTTLNVDDFFIMKAADESYAAIRSPTHGSLFIRALVRTFYKHANDHDIEEMFKIIQDRVRRESTLGMKHTGMPIGGNVPVSQCTFTNFRKLYFFPKYNGVRHEDD